MLRLKYIGILIVLAIVLSVGTISATAGNPETGITTETMETTERPETIEVVLEEKEDASPSVTTAVSKESSPTETTAVVEQTTTSQTEVMEPEEKDVYVASSALNIRSGPGTNYKVISKVNQGKRLSQIAAGSTWVQVNIDGITGYAYKTFLSENKPEPVETTAPSETQATVETVTEILETTVTPTLEQPQPQSTGYEIKIAEYPWIEAKAINNEYFGSFKGMNFTGRLAYGNSQELIDRKDTVCQVSVFNSNSRAIGTGDCAFIGDHNNQYFSALKHASIGELFYIDTFYGQFLYEVYEIGKVNITYYRDTGEFETWADITGGRGSNILTSGRAPTGERQLVLFTCTGVENERLVLYCKQIAGTVMVGEP